MSDGETLVSKGGKFEFGFFSPGNLVLTKNESLVWYTNNSHNQAQNPVAELLDSGNLVIRNDGETNPEAYLWQSFDYPSDTFLPGMKLGWNLRIGHEWKQTAWKSPDDPSPGDVYRVLELYNYPEFYVMKGTKKAYRFGPWNGLYFSGLSDFENGTMYSFCYVSNKHEISFTYSIANDSFIARSVANQTAITIYRYMWVVGEQDWKMSRSFPQEFCDTYSLCGAYGNCVSSTQRQACQCLKGFSPKSPEAWNSSDWSGGYIRGEGSGCVMWFGDLIDMKQLQTGKQDLYIRMAASELVSKVPKMHPSKQQSLS
ncbi:hypothetical protein JHK87_016491 [Glycine soja]|nr:hypothetical protein JHK87_016491 [Glycine soja]